MLSNDLVCDGFNRVKENVHRVIEGLDEQDLIYRPKEGANTIAWLIWHLTRVQDDHVAAAFSKTQLWHQGWSDKFNLPFDNNATGYGQSTKDVGLVKASGKLLSDYHDAVHAKTISYIGGLKEVDYQRVVDEHWQPPVTLAVRLVSVLADDLQHVGQAAYVRGLLENS